MLAVWYDKNGEAAEVLQVGEAPTPEPGPGEVRVRLMTSGINPVDVKRRRGARLPRSRPSRRSTRTSGTRPATW